MQNVIFVIIFVLVLRFLEIDNCLDTGGIFDNSKGVCISPQEEAYSSLL